MRRPVLLVIVAVDLLFFAGLAIWLLGRPRSTGTPEPPDPAPPAPALTASRGPAASEPAPKTVREAAVAGLFYPAEPRSLRTMIDGFLKSASAPDLGGVPRAVIVPHAGYRYSGPTAACAYKALEGRLFRTVIILAPSHYALFDGASIPDVEAYRTPLGLIPVSPLARRLAAAKPFALQPPARVHRPPWAADSPKPIPAYGEENAHTWEHSLEVQLPFLQEVLKDFAIVPIVYGQVDERAMADALLPVIDDHTLLVASSDLSHYHPYEEARVKDSACVQAVTSMNFAAMKEQEACGLGPILTVMYLAKAKGWTPRRLDYRNSGDTAGDKRAVVGYAAVVFVGPPASSAPASTASAPVAAASAPAARLAPADARRLLELARTALREVTATGRLPQVDPATLSAALRADGACFVTLTKSGELRGCIGHLVAQMPLYQAVLDNTRNAARRDPRFPPVRTNELDQIRIEISVLTPPEPLAFSSPEDLLAKLVPGRDGVILKIGGRQATFLPQVWEQLPDKAEFLDHLSRKAGLPGSAWRGRDVQVLTYRVDAFHEGD